MLEGILRDYAVNHGADIQWGQIVTDVVDLGDTVAVHRAGGAPLQARYVIVADGARAGLLPRLGIGDTVPAAGPFAESTQVLFRSRELDTLMATRSGRAFFCTATQTIVFRRDLHRWQLQRIGRGFDDVPADVAGAIGRPVDVEVLDRGTWRPSAGMAERLRLRNVFLVGDAAQAMPPSLGMGANLAIADAHNLAWKLAWVLAGRAGAGLLDSYDAERRPIGTFVLHESLVAMRPEDTHLDLLTVQLGLGYPAGASSALYGIGTEVTVSDPRDPTPTVGARLPHRWLPDGRSTLDLAGVDTFATLPDGDRVWLVRPDGHIAAHVPAADVDATRDTLLSL